MRWGGGGGGVGVALRQTKKDLYFETNNSQFSFHQIPISYQLQPCGY